MTPSIPNSTNSSNKSIKRWLWYVPFPEFYEPSSLDGAIHLDDYMRENGKFQLFKNHPLKGTLHDSFTPPEVKEFQDIINFFHKDLLEKNPNLSPNAETTQMFDDIQLAIQLAWQYVEKRWIYISKIPYSLSKKTQKQFVDAYKKLYEESLRNTTTKMHLCTFLKIVLSLLRVIQYKKFQPDYETGKIDLRNKEFIKYIISIFDDKEHFIYNKKAWDFKFSKKSSGMQWSAEIDGIRFPISGIFDVKWLWSVVEKMNTQEKYDSVEAFKDLHRMRIEVSTPKEALLIARLLYKKLSDTNEWNIWWAPTLENIGGMVSQEEADRFMKKHLGSNMPGRKEFSEELSKAMNEKVSKKAASAKRKELKLTRSEKGGSIWVEIQIVLRDSANEIGYAHHAIYRIKRAILEKIRLQWYIRSNGIDEIIRNTIAEDIQKKWFNTITIAPEDIKKHAHETLWLIEIIGSDAKSLDNKKIKAYSNSETLIKYIENYRENAKKIQAIFKHVQATARKNLPDITWE